MELTSRKNELMLRTSKGLFFAKIYKEGNEINLIVDFNEIFFDNKWVKACAEVAHDKFVVCIMGDSNVYIVDRLINLVQRFIKDITFSCSSIQMYADPRLPNFILIHEKDSLKLLSLYSNKMYKLLDIECDQMKDFQ
jgi:hypothetical protein